MGTHKLAGFTIIETVLFFAISSLLVISLVSATGASLNNQRYKDASETFKSVLQQQYADLISVQNARDNDWYCGSDALPSDDNPSIQEDRGQSECTLIGKYIRIENSDMAIYSVIGFGDEPALVTDDISTLRNNYKLNVSTAEFVESNLEWGTQIAWPKRLASNTPNVIGPANPTPASPRKLGILIVRSPSSGQIYTFSTGLDSEIPDTDSINPDTFSDMLQPGTSGTGRQGEQLICIDSKGLFINSDQAVYLNKFASSSTAVEARSNSFMLKTGGPQC